MLTGSINYPAAGVVFTATVGAPGVGQGDGGGGKHGTNRTNSTLSGSITRVHDSQAEFYNGEFSGSTLIISKGELNEGCAQFKSVSPIGADFQIRAYTSQKYSFNNWVSTFNDPLDGYIQTWFQDNSSVPLPAPGRTATM